MIFKVKIGLPWTAAITELRFMKSSVGTETTEVTGIVEVIMMILASKKWLLEAVTVLGLTGTALAAATVQN